MNIDSFVAQEGVMKTKPMLLSKPTKSRIEELQKKSLVLPKTNKTNKKYLNFKNICNEDKQTVDSVLVLVCTISRVISTKFGDYKICNILDVENTPLSMNVYAPHLNMLSVNEVFTITHLKKIRMSNGDTRLTTSKFSKIQPANSDENKLFHEYRVDTPVIDGCCVMYTDLSYYKSCHTHKTKLPSDQFCMGCKKKIIDAENNFHCMLHIETKDLDDLIPILIFKSHLNIGIKMTETKMEETIEQFVINKNVKIHFNKKGDSNIATDVVIYHD